MSRFLKTFLFVLFVGNAFGVVPHAAGRLSGLDLVEQVQRVGLNELVAVVLAYFIAMAWVAARMVPRRAPVEMDWA